jgi:hypothetical protein
MDMVQAYTHVTLLERYPGLAIFQSDFLGLKPSVQQPPANINLETILTLFQGFLSDCGGPKIVPMKILQRSSKLDDSKRSKDHRPDDERQTKISHRSTSSRIAVPELTDIIRAQDVLPEVW